jgi:SAM-dependent methyltransferase
VNNEADATSYRSLDANHRYVLDWATREATDMPNPRVLDFGCGSGEVVLAGRAQGLEMYGAEVFYAGGDVRPRIQELGLLGNVVREIRDGRLDFADSSFDLVLANQVFEHVDDFEPVLDEIHRVLKPGGSLLALFPSKEVLREGHIGIPLVHRLPAGRGRRSYTVAMRRLGLGYNKADKSPSVWADDALAWLDEYTTYRTKRAALAPFLRRFRVSMREDDFLRFRLRMVPRLAPLAFLLRTWVGTLAARVVVQRGMGMVIEARKPSVDAGYDEGP